LIRFYGFSLGEVENMGTSTFVNYLEALEIIEAQEFLAMTRATTFPHMKESDRKDINRDMVKKASKLNEKVLTSEDFAKIMMGDEWLK